MTNSLYVPSGLIVYLIVTALLHATANAKATRDADNLVFGPTTTIQWLLIALILGFACGAIYVSLIHPPVLIGTVIFGLISVAGTVAFPSNVLVNSAGVSEIKWWGGQTAIPWKEVNRIEYHKGPATTVVIGKDGRKVVHSGWNRDTKGFLESCEGRTGLSAKTSAM